MNYLYDYTRLQYLFIYIMYIYQNKENIAYILIIDNSYLITLIIIKI